MQGYRWASCCMPCMCGSGEGREPRFPQRQQDSCCRLARLTWRTMGRPTLPTGVTIKSLPRLEMWMLSVHGVSSPRSAGLCLCRHRVAQRWQQPRCMLQRTPVVCTAPQGQQGLIILCKSPSSMCLPPKERPLKQAHGAGALHGRHQRNFVLVMQ